MRRLPVIIFICIFYSVSYVQIGIAADPIPVFVSIVPQQYFVQQIGKDLVDVRVMVQPGASPATYEPKPKQMAGISKAKAYFAIGVPFEKVWLKKIAAANPNMKVIHTDYGIEKIPMPVHHDHHHGEAHEHKQGEGRYEQHGRPDPHIWLSPPLVKIQARTILNALQKIDPFHSTVYKRNYDQFVSKIDDLHGRLKKTFAGKQDLRFMVFHPAWGYFAHTYGIEEVSIEIEGKAPKPAQLKAMIEQARAKGIKVIFVQPQFSMKSAKLIAKEIGGQVAVANPLAEDWTANLSEIAEKFRAALK